MTKEPMSRPRAIIIALLSGFKVGDEFTSRSNKTGYLTNSLDKQVNKLFKNSKLEIIRASFHFHPTYYCYLLDTVYFSLYCLKSIGLENWGLDFDFVIGKNMPRLAKEAQRVLTPKEFKLLQKLGLKKLKLRD